MENIVQENDFFKSFQPDTQHKTASGSKSRGAQNTVLDEIIALWAEQHSEAPEFCTTELPEPLAPSMIEHALEYKELDQAFANLTTQQLAEARERGKTKIVAFLRPVLPPTGPYGVTSIDGEGRTVRSYVSSI